MGENKTEPLAKTRTRRSNAGARMHEMMFAAEEDEVLAQTLYGSLLKNEDDSSDDEEYVPKDLEDGNEGKANLDEDDDEAQSESDSCSSSSDSGDDDEDEEEDEEEEEEDEEEDEKDKIGEGGNKKSQTFVDGPIGDKISSIRQLKSNYTKLSQESILKDTPSNSKAITHNLIQPGSPIKSAYDSCKKICSVCLGDQSDEDDEIIECDACGVSVHESCYGVTGDELQHNSQHQQDQETKVKEDIDTISIHSNISSESTEPWFCEPCKRSVKNLNCELCPNTGGIFKQTDTGRWVHMVCALYTRGVTFENIDNLSEVSLFEINYQLYGSKVRNCSLTD